MRFFQISQFSHTPNSVSFRLKRLCGKIVVNSARTCSACVCARAHILYTGSGIIRALCTDGQDDIAVLFQGRVEILPAGRTMRNIYFYRSAQTVGGRVDRVAGGVSRRARARRPGVRGDRADTVPGDTSVVHAAVRCARFPDGADRGRHTGGHAAPPRDKVKRNRGTGAEEAGVSLVDVVERAR